MRFLGSGIIGGSLSRFELGWKASGAGLIIHDGHGISVASLSPAPKEPPHHLQLNGSTHGESVVRLVLERIEMPSGVDLGLPQHSERAAFLKCAPKERENLVIVRAGSDSLHTNWDRSIEDSDRNWDLCVSYYEQELCERLGECEYFVHQSNDRKFSAIYSLLYPDSPLWNYNYVWMPDDDLETNWRDINRLFEISRRFNLILSQPSLTHNSFISHGVTRQNSHSVLRFTEFVEVMCPIFSREALLACVGTFRGSWSGWGLDHIWPRMVGEVYNRIAIIDEVAVTHTRCVGQSDDKEAALHEALDLLQLYGMEPIRGFQPVHQDLGMLLSRSVTPQQGSDAP